MRNALIAEADRTSEMTVVRNEFERNEGNASQALLAALVSTAFREHPYHHPPMGWRDDVENLSTARLREYYESYYQPNNATVFVVGDVDAERTFDLVAEHFGVHPRPSSPIPEVYTSESPQIGERTVTLKRPGVETLVAYAYHTPAALGQVGVLNANELADRLADREGRRATYALDLAWRILGHGRMSRFSRALVDQRLALRATAWNWASRDPGLFQIIVKVGSGQSPSVVREALDTAILALAADGPTADELTRAKRQVAVHAALSRDGTFSLANHLAHYEAVGSWRLTEEYVDRIDAISIDDVRDAVKAYLHEDNRTVGMVLAEAARTFGPFARKPVAFEPPSEAGATAASPAVARHMSGRPFADRIARMQFSGAMTGVYVANPQSGTVVLRGLFEAGPASSPGRPYLPGIVAKMLERGTRARGRFAIEERLERYGIRRSYSVDDEPSRPYDALAFRFTAMCAAPDLPVLLETLAEELREPAFDEREFELVKARALGLARLSRARTDRLATERFLRLAYEPNDANALLEIEDVLAGIASLSIEDVNHYHTATIMNAPALLSAAGSVEPAAFERLVEDTLGTLPMRAITSAADVPPVRARIARDERVNVFVENRTSVDVIMGRATTLARSDPSYLAAIVANGVLGQSSLSSRLSVRLRDREGLTYGIVSSFLGAGRLPGPWRISFTVNPANVDRAITSVLAELRAFECAGPSERELAIQRSSMWGKSFVGLGTNDGIAMQIERIVYHDLGDDHIDTYRERLSAISPDAVRATIASNLGPKNLITITAGTYAE
jgi:zinc protease